MQFSSAVLFASVAIAATTTSTAVVADTKTTLVSVIDCGPSATNCPGSSTVIPSAIPTQQSNISNFSNFTVPEYTGAAAVNVLAPAAAVAAAVALLL
ncbi:hypothetical protein WICPIJ_005180 [Wickerhamomyces pijperi]|uniref:Uncharacterized protein n=1 Tax=Wickerhamomyces pijperi TaxID=599730 RepID=A0A9P8Q428_WICPI|nr:hypothetical protein WICPIJ_005180 [Wickerhamomyces pijperi]